MLKGANSSRTFKTQSLNAFITSNVNDEDTLSEIKINESSYNPDVYDSSKLNIAEEEKEVLHEISVLDSLFFQ